MTAHAKLSASGASRWSVCTAAPDLEAGFPDTSSPFAEEGTLAHAVAEALLTRREPPAHPPEMREFIDTYIAQLDQYNNVDYLRVEHRTDFSEWVPDGFGIACRRSRFGKDRRLPPRFAHRFDALDERAVFTRCRRDRDIPISVLGS